MSELKPCPYRVHGERVSSLTVEGERYYIEHFMPCMKEKCPCFHRDGDDAYCNRNGAYMKLTERRTGMKTLKYVIDHYEEFEQDTFLDRRWTKRFLDFLPSEEWKKYGFEIKEGATHTPIEWTEENILKQLKRDVEFGKEKAEGERGISSELMAMVVNAWCKVLENGLNLDGDDGWYHHRQFDIVAEHYGWLRGEQDETC